MNLLFVGVFDPSSTNYSQRQYLSDAGFNVFSFPYREVARREGHEKRDDLLVKTSEDIGSGVMLISKGNTISIETVRKCSKNMKTILWYMDTMNNFNSKLIEKIKACDATVCAWSGPFRAAREHHEKVYHVPEGYDPKVNKPIPIIKEYDVSFIGKLDGDRPKYVEEVNAVVFKDAFDIQHSVVVSRSRININLTRKGGTSDRVYKVLAAGGFLLTQKWPGMEDEFEAGVDLAVFDDPMDLKGKVGYYLPRQAVRHRIAEHGRRTVQKYSRAKWAQRIKEIANEI